jgi:hypothetical protein
MSTSIQEKLKVIKEKNTFFSGASPDIEKEYQRMINKTIQALDKWRNLLEKAKPADDRSLQKLLADFITEDCGLRAALTLCGLSNEKMFRIFSFLRAAYAKGAYKTDSPWAKEIEGAEWKEDAILAKLRNDNQFAFDFAGILLGHEPLVINALSMFEREYFKKEKFLFEGNELLDTLARYSLHGSYSAAKGIGPEQTLKQILDTMGVPYTSGKVKGIDRRIDLIIPSKTKPKIFVEVAYVETTSSGMGDKAKAERDTVAKSINQNYPGALFVAFVDGAGWLVREEAMRIVCEAADYVFTFHTEQLEEFKKLVSRTLSVDDYKPSLSQFLR